MKATAKLLVAAVAAGGTLLAAQAEAQDRNPVGRSARGAPAAVQRSADAPSNNAGTVDHGGRGWHRGDGHWHGHGRWGGHRYGYWGGYRHWSPHWSFYFGVPVLWGSWYWGAPYWYDYPGHTVVYREVERDPSFPEGRMGPATTEVPRSGPGMPSQGPLYMNYCESAKAYFPKVTSCPEGWKLATPTS